MPDLAGSLRSQDLEQLSNIAELWGIDLSAPDARRARLKLVQAILDRRLIAEVTSSLPDTAQQALLELQSAGGRLPWAQFTRTHGDVREMGPARINRIQPHRNPRSTVERLWYRALIARAFFDTPSGPQEFAYIPEDLLELLPAAPSPELARLGRPALPEERTHPSKSADAIVDHACTLLAGLRIGFSPEQLLAIAPEISPPPTVFIPLLETAGLLDVQGLPHAEDTRSFLEAPRSNALAQLARAWLASETYNDLRMVPHLEAEGVWQNQPLPARRAVISFLQKLPEGKWWHLPSFIDAIHHRHPDFQRPSGDYDSWYLKDERTGAYLRGFERWQDVEGALLRWIITGPLHWFSLVDLAASASDSPATSFRLTPFFDIMLSQDTPPESPPEDAVLYIDSTGRIDLPSAFPRAARYQLARFCYWEPLPNSSYSYRLTPASLERARAQGLTVKQLIALLRKHSAADVPPNILHALRRWDSRGTQAHLDQVVVLRLTDPAILKALQSSRAARFLGDPIGPAAVLVNPGARQQILDALAELGYLAHTDFTRGESTDD